MLYSGDPFLAQFPHPPGMRQLRDKVAKMRPNAEDEWVREDRSFILEYIAWRDEGLCGLCAVPLKEGVNPLKLTADDVNVEHIIPRVIGRFLLNNGKASNGDIYESRVHHIDNLQAAHPRCNKHKGNKPQANKWRHPVMCSVPAAKVRATPGGYLWLPYNGPQGCLW